jgi:putative membrane protein
VPDASGRITASLPTLRVRAERAVARRPFIAMRCAAIVASAVFVPQPELRPVCRRCDTGDRHEPRARKGLRRAGPNLAEASQSRFRSVAEKGNTMELILSWLILSVAVWLTAALLPGFHVKSFGSAVLVAAVFGVLNFLLGWLLFAVFAVVTLGIAWLLAFITRWIIDAILLVLTDRLTDHLRIDGFGWALGGALSMAVLGTVGEWLVRAIF